MTFGDARNIIPVSPLAYAEPSSRLRGTDNHCRDSHTLTQSLTGIDLAAGRLDTGIAIMNEGLPGGHEGRGTVTALPPMPLAQPMQQQQPLQTLKALRMQMALEQRMVIATLSETIPNYSLLPQQPQTAHFHDATSSRPPSSLVASSSDPAPQRPRTPPVGFHAAFAASSIQRPVLEGKGAASGSSQQPRAAHPNDGVPAHHPLSQPAGVARSQGSGSSRSGSSIGGGSSSNSGLVKPISNIGLMRRIGGSGNVGGSSSSKSNSGLMKPTSKRPQQAAAAAGVTSSRTTASRSSSCTTTGAPVTKAALLRQAAATAAAASVARSTAAVFAPVTATTASVSGSRGILSSVALVNGSSNAGGRVPGGGATLITSTAPRSASAGRAAAVAPTSHEQLGASASFALGASNGNFGRLRQQTATTSQNLYSPSRLPLQRVFKTEAAAYGVAPSPTQSTPAWTAGLGRLADEALEQLQQQQVEGALEKQQWMLTDKAFEQQRRQQDLTEDEDLDQMQQQQQESSAAASLLMDAFFAGIDVTPPPPSPPASRSGGWGITSSDVPLQQQQPPGQPPHDNSADVREVAAGLWAEALAAEAEAAAALQPSLPGPAVSAITTAAPLILGGLDVDAWLREEEVAQDAEHFLAQAECDAGRVMGAEEEDLSLYAEREAFQALLSEREAASATAAELSERHMEEALEDIACIHQWTTVLAR